MEEPKKYVRDRLQSLCILGCGTYGIICRLYKELQNYLLAKYNWEVEP